MTRWSDEELRNELGLAGHIPDLTARAIAEEALARGRERDAAIKQRDDLTKLVPEAYDEGGYDKQHNTAEWPDSDAASRLAEILEAKT